MSQDELERLEKLLEKREAVLSKSGWKDELDACQIVLKGVRNAQIRAINLENQGAFTAEKILNELK